jgi:uncharacterized damage-inducible protein DinB
MSMIQTLIQELEQEAQTTRRVLERVPGDRLEWKPNPKSMSLGQLSLHVATIPGFVSDIARQSPFSFPKMVQPSAASTAELVPALTESVARAKANLLAIGDGGLADVWRVVEGGRELMAIPVGGVVRSIMLNHWYHHRGQLSVYLRELGVPLPSIYGPSADENPFMDAQPSAAAVV